MSKISDQYYPMKENGTVNIGRFPSKHIQKILEPSGSIQVYYQRSNSNSTLIEKGVPSGILFFSIHRGQNNPIVIDKQVFEKDCTCKVNVYRKQDHYVMKIKPVKGDE